ncbi:MAG: ComF family protein [Acidobacteria bacterium]|nr:ComF family protein [Acidobacteriota bacterium]
MARSAAIYDGPMRDIVHAFKYAGRRTLARDLARLMRAAGEEVLEGAHGLVPVPLHPRRALARGFNQADDLARCLGAPVWPVLRRRRYGRPQAGRSRSDRHAGVRRAFAIVRAPVLHRGGRSLAGATVVLIDDVMTTGATIEACAEILLAAGVRSVRALTAARAVAARPRPRLPPRPPSSTRHR